MGDIETKSGMALHICLNAFRAAWRKFEGTHLVVCLEGHSWRNEIYPEYKAHRRVQAALLSRKEREDDAFYFEVMNQFCEFLKKRTNVTVLQSRGLEADDLIARWIDLHPEDDHTIVSGDSDFYQLLAPNVKIFDGVKGWTITLESVLDENNNPAITKKTVTSKSSDGSLKKETIEEAVEPPNPEYELFKKIIRGDSSDNIMSAYPKAREKGSNAKPGILDAWEDRKTKGLLWNNFMLHEWKKPVGMNSDTPTFKNVRVIDEFKINQHLIDLRAQPKPIVDLLNSVILDAVQKPVRTQIGVWFLRFCDEMSLVNIMKSPNEYAQILSAPYPKES